MSQPRTELDPVTHEDPSYARGWNDALQRDPCAPGGAHRYRIECEVCGQIGTLRVSVDPPNAPEPPDPDHAHYVLAAQSEKTP